MNDKSSDIAVTEISPCSGTAPAARRRLKIAWTTAPVYAVAIRAANVPPPLSVAAPAASVPFLTPIR